MKVLIKDKDLKRYAELEELRTGKQHKVSELVMSIYVWILFMILFLLFKPASLFSIGTYLTSFVSYMDIIYFYDDVGMQGTYLPTTALLGTFCAMLPMFLTYVLLR